jgi:hypothetical protein
MTDSVFDGAADSPRLRKHAITWRLFLVLVSLATLFPFVAFPYAQHVIAGTETAQSLVVAVVFVGANFHVAATAWFYTDTRMHSHFRARPLRYLAVPGLLVAGSAAIFQFSPPALRPWLLAAFFCWQLWHYQKQNVGLLSFVSAGTDGVPLSVWERRTLMLAAIAGILGFFSLAKIGLSAFATELAWLHQVGAAVYLLVPVALGVAIVKTPALRTNGLRLFFLVLGSLFFLPTFLFSDAVSATLSYAMAHGLQYLVFMGVVSLGHRNPIASVVLLLGLATIGALALNAAVQAPDISDLAWGYAAYGAFVGVVMAHFVLDAGIWRLREPFQRGYMREKFYFVFDR